MAFFDRFFVWLPKCALGALIFSAFPLHAFTPREFKIPLCRYYLHMAANAGASEEANDSSIILAVNSIRKFRRDTFGDETPEATYKEASANANDEGNPQKVAARLRGIEEFYAGTNSAKNLGDHREMFAQQFTGIHEISEFLSAYQELSAYEKLLSKARVKSVLFGKRAKVSSALALGFLAIDIPSFIIAELTLFAGRMSVYLGYTTVKNRLFLEDMVRQLEKPTPNYWAHYGMNTQLLNEDITLLKNIAYGFATEDVQGHPSYLVNVNKFHTLDFETGRTRIEEKIRREWVGMDMLFHTDENSQPVLTLVARVYDAQPAEPHSSNDSPWSFGGPRKLIRAHAP